MITLLSHFALLQVVWWSTLLGAVHLPNQPWAVGLWIPAFFLLKRFGFYSKADQTAAFLLLSIGLVLDTIWIHLGWIEYSAFWPLSWICPLWVGVLWFSVGFDYQHSMLWIKKNIWLGGLITGASGPSSYWAGTALGIGKIPEDTALWFGIGLFCTWAFIFPLFTIYGPFKTTLKAQKNI